MHVLLLYFRTLVCDQLSVPVLMLMSRCTRTGVGCRWLGQGCPCWQRGSGIGQGDSESYIAVMTAANECVGTFRRHHICPPQSTRIHSVK